MRIVKISSKSDFYKNINVVRDFLNEVSKADIDSNLRENYALDSKEEHSLLHLFQNTDLFYSNAYFEIALEGDEIIGGTGVYVKDKLKYLYKRTFMTPKYRKILEYRPSNIFLPDQLEFMNNKTLFAIDTLNEDQKRIFLGKKRILEKKSMFFGESTEEFYQIYYKYNTHVLEDMYVINGIKQYVIVFDYHDLGFDKIDRIMNEKFKRVY